jgi:hypothetical protein
MSKKDLIEYICEINLSARPEVLASFSEQELKEYLDKLMASEKVPVRS